MIVLGITVSMIGSKVLERFARDNSKRGDIYLLLIVDPNIMEICSEYLIKKGWLGVQYGEDISKVLIENYTTRFKTLSERLQRLGEVKNVRFVVGRVDEILLKEVGEIAPDEIVVFKKKEEPIWAFYEPVFENLHIKLGKKFEIIKV